MNTTQQQRLGFAFRVGEEVLARLDGADILSLERGVPLPEAWRPRWTIGRVMECLLRDGRQSYVLRFLLDGRPYVSVVSEEAVEGTA